MSAKSKLSIFLDKPDWEIHDLTKLERLVGYNSETAKTFSGWTYWAQIGDVFETGDFDNLFLALDSAVEKFSPVKYLFKKIDIIEKSISAIYYPADMAILSRIREFMQNKGIVFVDENRDPFFSINVEVEEDIIEKSDLKLFIPSQTEIIFKTASILKLRRNKTRLYHRTKT